MNTTKSSTARKGAKNAILELANNSSLNISEIAKITKTSPSNVSTTLKRYNITLNRLNEYKSNRGDILASYQDRILSTISEADIKKAPLGSKVLAVCQLYDKERIERGLSNNDQPIMVIIKSPSVSIDQSNKVIDIGDNSISDKNSG